MNGILLTKRNEVSYEDLQKIETPPPHPPGPHPHAAAAERVKSEMTGRDPHQRESLAVSSASNGSYGDRFSVSSRCGATTRSLASHRVRNSHDRSIVAGLCVARESSSVTT